MVEKPFRNMYSNESIHDRRMGDYIHTSKINHRNYSFREFLTHHTPQPSHAFSHSPVFFFFLFSYEWWMCLMCVCTNEYMKYSISAFKRICLNVGAFQFWFVILISMRFKVYYDISTLLLFIVNIFVSFFKHSYVCWSTNCSANCITSAPRVQSGKSS